MAGGHDAELFLGRLAIEELRVQEEPPLLELAEPPRDVDARSALRFPGVRPRLLGGERLLRPLLPLPAPVERLPLELQARDRDVARKEIDVDERVVGDA